MVNETLLDDATALAAAGALNGRWLATAAQLGGVRLPDHVLPDLTLHLHAGTFVFGEDTGLIAIDRTRHPAALDLVATGGPNFGRFVPAVFEQAGGMLRICYDLSGRARPDDFRAPLGSRRFLVTYRRAELQSRVVLGKPA